MLPECNDSHEDLAERFEVYFSERIMDVRSTMYHHDAPLPVLPIDNNHNHHCTISTFTTTTAAAVVRLVNKGPSKSCALDPWPTTLLQTNLNSIAPVLADIINICNCTNGLEVIISLTVPTKMNNALVTPSLKKTGLDEDDINNYRPISNISLASKHDLAPEYIADMITEYTPGRQLRSAGSRLHAII